MMPTGCVHLIPTVLHEEEVALNTLPAYLTQAVQQCTVFFVENEKTARRYLKKLWREMVIDDYAWFAIHKAEESVRSAFLQCLREGKQVAILSEAGCPGIADPGQLLVEAAQAMGAKVKPYVGPSAILLALMASGMNGQCFRFNGYLPIDAAERRKALKELENESARQHCTQMFIETPYRNNPMIREILQTCKPETRFCIAADLTASTEVIRTQTIRQWQQQEPDFHKRPAIFLLQAE